VTLALSGPAFDVLSTSTPTQLTFNVVGATGAYASIVANGPITGTATLVLHNVRRLNLTTTPSRGFPGNFALVLQTTATPVVVVTG
jgi:hypothetical protein